MLCIGRIELIQHWRHKQREQLKLKVQEHHTLREVGLLPRQLFDQYQTLLAAQVLGCGGSVVKRENNKSRSSLHEVRYHQLHS